MVPKKDGSVKLAVPGFGTGDLCNQCGRLPEESSPGLGDKTRVLIEAGKAISRFIKIQGSEGEVVAIEGLKITFRDSKGKSNTITEAKETLYQIGQQHSQAGKSPLAFAIMILIC